MLSVDKDRGVVEVFCLASLNLQVRVAEELDRINAGIAIDMSRRVALAESDVFDIDCNQRFGLIDDDRAAGLKPDL